MGGGSGPPAKKVGGLGPPVPPSMVHYGFSVILERHHIPQQIITLFPFDSFCGAGSNGNHFGHPPEFKLASTCQ